MIFTLPNRGHLSATACFIRYTASHQADNPPFLSYICFFSDIYPNLLPTSDLDPSSLPYLHSSSEISPSSKALNANCMTPNISSFGFSSKFKPTYLFDISLRCITNTLIIKTNHPTLLPSTCSLQAFSTITDPAA